METLTSWLKTRYDAVLQSGSDSQFYQNVHQYIDFIVKTPLLAEVLEKSREEYELKFHEIVGTKEAKTEREADEREEAVRRLEQFSLYAADFAFLYSRIYVYIEEYKNNTEPDERPYPAAIIMLRGISGITTKLWSKKTLDQYNRWYARKRKEYEDKLRKFHADFLIALEKVKSDKKETDPKLEKPKIPLSLDPRTGDFRFYNTMGNFSPVGQEFKVLSTLFNSESYQATHLSLLQSYMPGLEADSKAHRDNLSLVIRNIKQELNILPKTKTSNPDIFKSIKKLGYRLILKPEKVRTE